MMLIKLTETPARHRADTKLTSDLSFEAARVTGQEVVINGLISAPTTCLVSEDFRK